MMSKVLKSPSKYVQGPGVLGEFDQYLQGMGRRLLVIISRSGVRRVCPTLEACFAGKDYQLHYEIFSGECSQSQIDRLTAAAAEQQATAVVGIGGVRTTPEARDAVETLVRNAGRLGYAVVTGGEPGVSHVAAGMAEEYGVELIEILGGGMGQRTAELAEAGELAARCSGISLEHPDALFTISHAITRNRVLFALSDAAIVFNTDGKRGESEAIVHGYCDWIYAWRGHASTQGLIARGAYPIDSFATLDMDQMARDWRSSRAEQLSMFDLFGE